MSVFRFAIGVACFAFACSAMGQPPAELLKVGEKAPDFSGLEGVDGKKYSLNDFRDKDILVVVFTCNSCGYAVDYEDRICKFSKEHCSAASRVGLLAINSNKVAEDLPEKMKEKAEEKNFDFPYVFDESQNVARGFGALYTPAFFVLDRDRKLVYKGAFDDNPKAELATTSHVVEAIKLLLDAKAIETPETQAIGCRVRYERAKRRKEN